MKGFVKVIIAGAIILGIGIAILIIALAVNGWKFEPNMEFETKEYTSGDGITDLSVTLNAGKLKIEYRDDDSQGIYVSYPTAKSIDTTISQKNGKLSIYGNKHKWYTFAWAVQIPETVVKIPKNTITDISITLNAGTLELPDGEFKRVDVKVNAGTCSVGKITDFELFKIDVNAGSATVDGINGQKLDCEVNAGAANIKSITCKETTVEVNAGSANIAFNGTRLNYTAFVEVSAGKCNGLSDSGNPYPDLSGKDQIHIKVSAGTCNVNFLG